MSTAHVLGALIRLEGMAVAGLPPDDVAHEAELIAAGWWRDGHGDLGPDRLVPLVQEMQRWCVATSGRHAARWGVHHCASQHLPITRQRLRRPPPLTRRILQSILGQGLANA